MAVSQITLIGSGRLAWHLAPALEGSGYVVGEVYSRVWDHAKALSRRLYRAEPRTSLDFSTSHARIFVVAVQDDAIRSVVQHMLLPEGAVLLHTSGSMSIRILETSSTSNTGVFYPLQSFTKDKSMSFKGLPVLLEANNKDVEQLIVNMAHALGAKPHRISSSVRETIHLAAVFASNFVNHMLSISRRILRDHDVDPNLLNALISETVAKALAIGPQKAQTGPAKRHDTEVIKNHMHRLDQDMMIADIYRAISRHIMQLHPPEEAS